LRCAFFFVLRKGGIKMKKILKKSVMAIDDFCRYLFLPTIMTFAFFLCSDAHMFGLSTGWTAYILSGIVLLAALYRWDLLTQTKVRAVLAQKNALIELRAEELLEEGRKAISEEEGLVWWDDHFDEVISWSGEITGCGKEA